MKISSIQFKEYVEIFKIPNLALYTSIYIILVFQEITFLNIAFVLN